MCDEKLKEIQELEAELSYLIRPDMTQEEKEKALENAYWRAHNAGYCDYIAGQRMAGVDDGQVQQHNQDLKHRYEVSRLLELFEELKSEELEACWQEASDLFDRDSEAGYKAFLSLAERGLPHAMHSVGWCLRYGNGVERDVAKAEEYYTRAARSGYLNSYANIYWLKMENDMPAGALDFLLEGARRGSAGCFESLAILCDSGELFSGNPKVTAYLASRAYELDPEYGAILAMVYLRGTFFPTVYPYAKHCLAGSYMTREVLEESGVEFPDFWEEIQPIPPKYPAFDLTLETCEGAVDPVALLHRAQELTFGEAPDREAAKPYVRQAVDAGSSQAMYYTYILDMEGWQISLVRGAEEYGDGDCIELLAALFSEQCTYRIGHPMLNEAVHYWNLRKRLHGQTPLGEANEKAYKIFREGLDRAFGRDPRRPDPEANAVLLRADGTHERVKVDFTTLEGLYAPLGCDRINAISTQALRDLSDRLGFTVVMYCDERGMSKGLPENTVAASLSGYDVIFGDVVVCGFEKDYAPLGEDELEDICTLLMERA